MMAQPVEKNTQEQTGGEMVDPAAMRWRRGLVWSSVLLMALATIMLVLSLG